MKYSNNKIVNMVLKFIGDEKIKEIDNYASDIKDSKALTFTTPHDIDTCFYDYIKELYHNTKHDDIEKIRYYTGISYNKINALLRNKWDYEKCGVLTDDIAKDIKQLADDISNLINKSPDMPDNIKAYRGVSLSTFSDYGVTSISNLKSLVGQYIYEQGFTSTSLIRDKSFFDRELDYHSPCNIEIEYLIPKESNDGIPLTNELLSYSNQQTEFLINKGSLSKIIDVTVDEESNKAYIKALLVPKKVWDISYREELNKETENHKNNSK